MSRGDELPLCAEGDGPCLCLETDEDPAECREDERGLGDTERLEDVRIDENSERVVIPASTCLSTAPW